MSDNPQQPQAPGGNGQPRIQINAQYVKDLSFENPNAPQSLVPSQTQPRIQVSVDVGARGVGNNRYEVELRISGKAMREEQTIFVVELQYAGLFTLHNVEGDAVKLVCLIECPRILFPFARRIIADATRDGGFPPLMLEPIDFVALYQQQQQRQQTQQQAAGDGQGQAPST